MIRKEQVYKNVILTCVECGERFEKRITGGAHKFCSRKCGCRNWNKNNKEHVAEYRNRTADRRNLRQRERYATDEDYRLSTISDVKAYCKRNPNRHKKENMKKFGLSIDDYFRILEYQKWKCPICGISIDGGKSTHIDHDHATNKFRGIICESCNLGIGKFYDNPNTLIMAAEYLKGNIQDGRDKKQ
jgi:endogenous inhibitor of DNA gyrase (YacG/DUF329 family)